MNDISDTNNGILSEPVSDIEQNGLDMTAQILTACIEEYPDAQLEVVDYKKAYQQGGSESASPHITGFHNTDYQYFIVPIDRQGAGATLGIPIFAQGFIEKIQDKNNSDTQYIIYPSKNCTKIDILKFPTEILRPFLTNDILRNQIANGANADTTLELKQRFEAIRKISGKFNPKA